MRPVIPLADEVNLGDIIVSEAFQSGSFSRQEGENQSVSFNFIIKGAVDAYPAYLALMNHLRNNFWHEGWGCCAAYNLPLQDVTLESMDCNFAYTATCTFKMPTMENTNGGRSRDQQREGTSYNNPVINEPTFKMPEVEPQDFNYSVSGEQSHISRSKGTKIYKVDTEANGCYAEDYQNGIGWNGESFNGVDISEPISAFSISISAPKTWITTEYRNLLIQYNSTINSLEWAGFPSGCVLFRGASAKSVSLNYTDEEGNSVRDWYWRLNYEFEARGRAPYYHPSYDPEHPTAHKWYNTNDTASEPFILVDGYQYVWYTYNEKIEDGQRLPKIKQMNVEDVYLRFDFRNLLIPGLTFEEDPSSSGEGE